MTKQQYMENHGWRDDVDCEPCCEICGRDLREHEDVIVCRDATGEWMMCFRCAKEEFGVRGILELIEELESWEIANCGDYIERKARI